MSVPPERLARWLLGFAERHDGATPSYDGNVVRLAGGDGAVAEVEVPFGPLVLDVLDDDAPDGQRDAGDDLIAGQRCSAALVAHCLRERRIGVLLVRLGGHAAGVFEGRRLVSSKVGSRQVHGRSAAGGWSQQRFARRREGQVSVALAAAADNAVTHLLPQAPTLEGVVVGGERTAVEAVLADRRLAALRPLVTGRLLDVPDPRLVVLRGAGDLARLVQIRVLDAG